MIYLTVLLALLNFTENGQKQPKFDPFLTENSRFLIQDTILQKSMERGGAIYADFCMQCHMADGAGVAGNIPPLAKADYLNEQTTASIKAVKYGLQGKITVNGETYENAMPSPGLYDDEVADVMNYILNSWGNAHAEVITEEQVTAITEE